MDDPTFVHTQAFHSYEGKAIWLSPPGRSNVRVRFGTGLKVSAYAPLPVEEGGEFMLGMGWSSSKGKGSVILRLRVEESRHGFEGVELVAMPTAIEVAGVAGVLESFLTRVAGVQKVNPGDLYRTDKGLQWRVPTRAAPDGAPNQARPALARLPVEYGVEGARVASTGSAYAYDGDGLSIYTGDVEPQAGDPVRLLISVPLPDRPVTLVMGGMVETLHDQSAFSVRLSGHNNVDRMAKWREVVAALTGGGG